jgi:transposase
MLRSDNPQKLSVDIEGDGMLSVPANARLFLCQVPMSMRKSFEGLSAVVEHMFPGELLSGALFIFLSRRRDHMKVLYWDGDGFAIFYKRLEKGRFVAKHNISSPLMRREFLMLLEGIEPKRLQHRFSL